MFRFAFSLALFGILLGTSHAQTPQARLAGDDDASVQQFMPGGTSVLTSTDRDQVNPSIAMSPSGTYVVAWENRLSSGTTIYARRYSSDGTAAADPFVVTNLSGPNVSPSVAMLPDGRFAIAWAQYNGSRWNVRFQRYAADGTTVGSAIDVRIAGVAHYKQPALTTAGSNAYAIAWQQVEATGTQYRVRHNVYDASTGAASTVQTVYTGTAWGGNPSIDGSDTSGNLVVAWQTTDGDGTMGVFAQRLGTDGTLSGGAITVPNTTTGQQLEPAVAINDATDTFVVTWTSGPSLTNTEVLARRFNADGTPAADAFVVNSTTSNTQRSPRVTTAAGVGPSASTFAITWDSFGQDGSTAGVYVQKYDSLGAAWGGEERVATTTDGFQQQSALAYRRIDQPLRIVWQSGRRYDEVGSNGYDVFTYAAALPLTLVTSAWLQGPYDTTNDNMTVGLSAHLPQSNPYPHLSGAVASSDFFTTDANGQNVIDWVWVGLRTGNPASPPMTRAIRVPALLLNDGSIKALDAASNLTIGGLSSGSYYLTVGHRNHLAVMSAALVDCSSGTCTYDFRTGSARAYGGEPMAEVETGVWALRAGDGSEDGQVTASDYQTHWRSQNGCSAGYRSGDFNLNGEVTAADFQTFWRPNNSRETRVPPDNN